MASQDYMSYLGSQADESQKKKKNLGHSIDSQGAIRTVNNSWVMFEIAIDSSLDSIYNACIRYADCNMVLKTWK